VKYLLPFVSESFAFLYTIYNNKDLNQRK